MPPVDLSVTGGDHLPLNVCLSKKQLCHGSSIPVFGDPSDADSQQAGQEISHDLLLEQGTPGDITAATQQDQGENHLAEGQQDDSTKADESDLLDHGLTLVSHGVPLGKSHCYKETV